MWAGATGWVGPGPVDWGRQGAPELEPKPEPELEPEPEPEREPEPSGVSSGCDDNGCAAKGTCGLPGSDDGLGGGWQLCFA